jgi:hypothetical protein
MTNTFQALIKENICWKHISNGTLINRYEEKMQITGSHRIDSVRNTQKIIPRYISEKKLILVQTSDFILMDTLCKFETK